MCVPRSNSWLLPILPFGARVSGDSQDIGGKFLTPFGKSWDFLLLSYHTLNLEITKSRQPWEQPRGRRNTVFFAEMVGHADLPDNLSWGVSEQQKGQARAAREIAFPQTFIHPTHLISHHQSCHYILEDLTVLEGGVVINKHKNRWALSQYSKCIWGGQSFLKKIQIHNLRAKEPNSIKI